MHTALLCIVAALISGCSSLLIESMSHAEGVTINVRNVSLRKSNSKIPLFHLCIGRGRVRPQDCPATYHNEWHATLRWHHDMYDNSGEDPLLLDGALAHEWCVVIGSDYDHCMAVPEVRQAHAAHLASKRPRAYAPPVQVSRSVAPVPQIEPPPPKAQVEERPTQVQEGTYVDHVQAFKPSGFAFDMARKSFRKHCASNAGVIHTFRRADDCRMPDSSVMAGFCGKAGGMPEQACSLTESWDRPQIIRLYSARPGSVQGLFTIMVRDIIAKFGPRGAERLEDNVGSIIRWKFDSNYGAQVSFMLSGIGGHASVMMWNRNEGGPKGQGW